MFSRHPEDRPVAQVCFAARRLCERAGLDLDCFDAIELNEAFAAQALACMRELDLGADRVNLGRQLLIRRS